MITSRSIIVYGAKKMMDNDIFRVFYMVKNTVLLWLLQLCFCFDVKVEFLTYNPQQH